MICKFIIIVLLKLSVTLFFNENKVSNMKSPNYITVLQVAINIDNVRKFNKICRQLSE